MRSSAPATHGSREACASGSSTRSASTPRISRASPSSASPCSVQFSHAPSDEHLAKRFWADKLAGVYSFRSLLRSGAVLANGSDAPIEELDPWAGVVAATLDHWREDERLSVTEALHAVCVAPARLSHDERARGTLVPGRLADLVVLDRDPFGCEPGELREVQVVATMSGGRVGAQPAPVAVVAIAPCHLIKSPLRSLGPRRRDGRGGTALRPLA